MYELPLFPLNTVLFPGMPIKLHIFEERYKLMISRCYTEGQPFGVALIKSGNEVGRKAEPFLVGCTAVITELEPLPDGRMNIVPADLAATDQTPVPANQRAVYFRSIPGRYYGVQRAPGSRRRGSAARSVPYCCRYPSSPGLPSRRSRS